VGDTLYGAPGKVEGMPALGRFFLHAHRIGFHLPSNGAKIELVSPLPKELQEWLAEAAPGRTL
jgi:23S rRNA-/tRNA-specific pseudouridylate synthase